MAAGQFDDLIFKLLIGILDDHNENPSSVSSTDEEGATTDESSSSPAPETKMKKTKESLRLLIDVSDNETKKRTMTNYSPIKKP